MAQNTMPAKGKAASGAVAESDLVVSVAVATCMRAVPNALQRRGFSATAVSWTDAGSKPTFT
jgi:hypothetical protein